MSTDNYESNRPASLTGINAISNSRQFSVAGLNESHDAKERVHLELVAQYGPSLNTTLIQRAVQEADSLASTTHFPSLFFPMLAEEKARSAFAWSVRQKRIQRETLAFAV